MTRIQDFQNFVLDALDVVEFKLIRSKEDIENDELSFHPVMAHQIFGGSESIFGYEELKVNILYNAGPMHIYIGTESSGKVDELTGGDIKADDVVKIIAKNLPDGCYFVNMDEFCKTLDKADKFQPFGEKINEYTHTNSETGAERTFELYQCGHKVNAFLKFFGRLQTFILWFVDAASYIDLDDPQWNFFICYEKYKNGNGDFQYATVAYCTVYEYYAYPQNIRPRISQMLVLPPFQKLGLGTFMLKSIYKQYQSQKNVVDITVEDPSDDFQRMRNYVDARLCKDLKSFSKTELKKGFNKEMVREARETLKLNPRQIRKIYEILRLYHTNIHDEQEYTAYRLDVKKRLNAIHHKLVNDIKKMEKAKLDTELLRATLPTTAERINQLREEYEVVETDYKTVVDKLRTCM